MTKIKTMEKYREHLENGSMRLFTTTITAEDMINEIVRYEQNLLDAEIDRYEQNLLDAPSDLYVVWDRPSDRKLILRILRQRIKATSPGWCGVRTSPSKASLNYWKNGTEYSCLIKLKYTRLALTDAESFDEQPDWSGGEYGGD